MSLRTPPQALSVLHGILGKPEVSVKMMTHFEKSMTHSEAENLMSWLLSSGEVDNDALGDIKKGGLKFPNMQGELCFSHVFCI